MRKNQNRGTYNETKTRILVYLAGLKDSGHTRPVSLRALCKATGTNYNYLKSRLLVWSNWGYLHAHIIFGYKGRPCFGYTLAANGRGYLNHQSDRRIRRARQSIFELGPAGSGLASMTAPGQFLKDMVSPHQGDSFLEGMRHPGSWLQDIAASANDDGAGDIDLDEIYGES
jgi:hypothetical protein